MSCCEGPIWRLSAKSNCKGRHVKFDATRLVQLHVQPAPAVHRRGHLNVVDGVKAEAAGDTFHNRLGKFVGHGFI
jgi:hypothetical protein